jgi:hypothetical protein
MSDETRGTLLHDQLQEGLRYDIMKAPAVSGSHGYKELCLSSRNEEKRLAELAKRRQYSKPPRTSTSAKNQRVQSSHGTKPQSETPSPQVQQQDEGRSMTQWRCYTCNRPGHLSRDCPTRRNENAVPHGRRPAGTRLVSTTGSGSQSPSAAPGLLSHLLSSSDSETEGEGVRQVRIDDEGSKQQYAEVLIEGVPATGVVDSGAEITIMNGKLVARIAAVARLKKSQLKPGQNSEDL